MGAQSAETAQPSIGDRVQMKFSCPNYDKGQIGTLTTFNGSSGSAVWWVDFGVRRRWSHGESESTGCWAGRGEFEPVPPTSDGAA